MKKIVVAVAGVLAFALLVGTQGTTPITAQPLRSPLPCPPEITPPGSVCWMESAPAQVGQNTVARWRVWLPAVIR